MPTICNSDSKAFTSPIVLFIIRYLSYQCTIGRFGCFGFEGFAFFY